MGFNMSIEYPQSRIQSSGQCDKCKGVGGFMVDRGRLNLQDASGNIVELMRWTCNKCGYTMLFDLSVPRQHPLTDANFQEILPD